MAPRRALGLYPWPRTREVFDSVRSFRAYSPCAQALHRLALPGAPKRVRMTSRPRIAVVEDNADNRLLVSALLGELYDVQEFPSGTEALAAVPADPPALVLLDVSLPGMDGIEVLRRLRATRAGAQLPVIALTAHAMRGDRERLLAAGFDDYVSKPIVDERVLLDAIARLVTREASS